MRAWVLLALLAGPAGAQVASVDTPQGVARVEGDPAEGGQWLSVGGARAYGLADFPYLWIEGSAGALILVGLSEGGTACPSLYAWVDASRPGFPATDTFGTCGSADGIAQDGGTVSVRIGSGDAERPWSLFTWDGKGAVTETPLGQEPSGSPPGAGPEAWVGRYAFDLFRSSDWRGPMVALLGEEGYRAAQGAIQTASPMERQGAWVVGSGFDPLSGGDVGGAVALGEDGRVLVALYGQGAPVLYGDPGGPLPPGVAEAMAR